jgi:signal peptidase I
MSEDPTRREPAFDPLSAPADPPASPHESHLHDGADAAPVPVPWHLSGERTFSRAAEQPADAEAAPSYEAEPSTQDVAWPIDTERDQASHAVGVMHMSQPSDYTYLDRYADVPAALELSYSNADMGLSERAFERVYPYEGVEGRKRRAKARRVGRELVETLLLAVLIFFAVKAVVQNFRVEGSSMLPSLDNDQYLLVNKAIYYRIDTGGIHKFLPFIPDTDGKKHLFRAPRRGDIIVFKFPLEPSRDFIKRVIGVPGDTVEVKGGKVYINGAPLVEPYELSAPNYTYAPKTVPPGQYFVLGDNRNNSYDSHAWQQQCSAQQTCNFVPEENIIGQAWISYWPFDDLGFVNNKKLNPQAP